jgi:cytoskeletal protein RodZ
MDQHTGQHANEAIFAANGAFRHRLLKAASAAFLALLAAWLIALALGVWGGFELLPGLPGSHSTRPSEAKSTTQHPAAPAPAQSHQSARAVRTASRSPAGSGTASGTGSGSGSGSGSGTTHSQESNPKATAPQPVQSPSTSSTPPSTSDGTTTTTGVPTDSPGNLPSGSEVPGQLP